MIALRLVRPALQLKVAKPAFRFSSIRFISTRYTTDHEWVSFDSTTNIGTVGITDYAQKALGDVVFVELPGQGAEVAQGDSIGAVESVKAASDIYAPVSGIVEEINETLADQPGLLNKSPEEKGWLAKIKLSAPAEFEALLNDEAYKAHCEGQ
ncbi:glycine cleavage system H protein [Kwoniella pini CBS 10737]|uniref:Glycine cleavage system H protein n=1 Tax=Kwoniella pini CBS 10737 TaxID=1296096 RepID=A0A1B9I8P3_9TREE|nr:glycine cleavage system H protein [Kwoniella pini CBS 10737]OCF51843.1 glycine cleavage system H protein [Kwoniella pini CBS 10737]